MAATRRIEVLMNPDEFKQLRALARRRKTSVADLIRCAVRESYLRTPVDRKALVEAILALKLPNVDWRTAKKEIEAAHAGLSWCECLSSVLTAGLSPHPARAGW
jgi:hypothetical protein